MVSGVLKISVTATAAVLEQYASELVRAGKGQKIPDPKVGTTIATLRQEHVSVLPGVKPADIDLVVNGLEQLLDRNLRANQLRHIAHEVDAPLMRVTTGLAAIFKDTSHCSAGSGTWCSIFAPEAQDLKDVWGPLAQSMQAGTLRQQRAATEPHPPEYFVAQWEVRSRFEADVKAHEDALALGPAYADALLAFQREHAALIAVIDARVPDSTALFDR